MDKAEDVEPAVNIFDSFKPILTMLEVEPTADFASFERMEKDPASLSWILSQAFENSEENTAEDVNKNAEISFTSITSEVPDDPSPRDARQALKTLQCFAAKNLFGVAAMDALMKLEVYMTDAKIDWIYRAENAFP